MSSLGNFVWSVADRPADRADPEGHVAGARLYEVVAWGVPTCLRGVDPV